MKTLTIGDTIPAFQLVDQNGKLFNIKDYKGQNLVIYFYPKDESAVCTKEACGFRDNFTEFTDAGVTVIGINSGSVTSHKSFAVKNRLPFTLLSDPGNIVLKKFGIKNVLFLTGRETFVVGPDGKIVFTHRGFLNGDAHSSKVIEFLKSK